MPWYATIHALQYDHTYLPPIPAAQIMNNLSSLIMSKPPSAETLLQAEAWARKSVAVSGQEIKGRGAKKLQGELDVCESTLAVALFNIASLREVSSNSCLRGATWLTRFPVQDGE